jgi:hypothetical protein
MIINPLSQFMPRGGEAKKFALRRYFKAASNTAARNRSRAAGSVARCLTIDSRASVQWRCEGSWTGQPIGHPRREAIPHAAERGKRRVVPDSGPPQRLQIKQQRDFRSNVVRQLVGRE